MGAPFAFAAELAAARERADDLERIVADAARTTDERVGAMEQTCGEKMQTLFTKIWTPVFCCVCGSLLCVSVHDLPYCLENIGHLS